MGVDRGDIRTFIRGLDILIALNRHNGSSLADITEKTGISRGAVHRSLETIVAHGYARKCGRRYFLEAKIHLLAAALQDADWLARSQAIIDDLCREVKWTISILRPNGLGMERCASTDSLSPLRFHNVPLGVRVPMLCSASGRAYMAFQPDNLRSLFIESLSQEAEFPEDQSFCQNRRSVIDMLDQVKRRGAATLPAKKGDTVLAVPIVRDESRILGSLCLRFFTASLPITEASARYVGKLHETAERIAALNQGIQSGAK